jgi:small subunit ribosomal protein S8
MLTRIRNAGTAGKSETFCKASKICEGIARVLREEGYISDFDRIDDNKQGLIRVKLKYTRSGEHVIGMVKRISKPGCRVYRGMKDLPDILGGLGIAVVSTSKGVMSDRNCRRENVGGEILCMVS